MNRKTNFFNQNLWSWKELIFLLFLILILVPIFIETLLQQVLTEWFQNNLYSGTVTGFIMSIIFTIGVYFIALRPNQLSWKEVGLQKPAQQYWGKTALWLVYLIIGSIILSYVLEFLFGIGTENSKTESLQTRLSGINFLIAFVSATIISPIYEEIFYRGFLYRWFRTKYGILSGMLISSIIFMIVHIPTYNTLPYTFLSGLIFSWTYEKTNSIYPAMIIHGAFNGLAIILTAML